MHHHPCKKMVLRIMILVIAILMIIIFPDESDESDESSGKFSGTQLSPTAAATAHFSLLLFAQPLAGWFGWLVGWLVRRLDSRANLLNPTLHDPMNSGFKHGCVILGYCLCFAIHADLQLLLLLLLGPGASKNSDACNYKITATLLASVHQK